MISKQLYDIIKPLCTNTAFMVAPKCTGSYCVIRLEEVEPKHTKGEGAAVSKRRNHVVLVGAANYLDMESLCNLVIDAVDGAQNDECFFRFVNEKDYGYDDVNGFFLREIYFNAY